MDESRELVGIPEIAEQLELEPEAARTVARSGLLGQTYRIGRQLVAERSSLEELSSWPTVAPPHPGATVIRLDLARPTQRGEDLAWPERKWIGWSSSLPSQEKLDAIRGWWRIGGDLKDTLAVFTLKSFVVEVFKIDGYDGEVGSVRRLQLAAADPQDESAFKRHRLHTGRGGNVINLAAAK